MICLRVEILEVLFMLLQIFRFLQERMGGIMQEFPAFYAVIFYAGISWKFITVFY